MAKNFKIACLQTRPMPNFDSALKEMYDLGVSAVNNGAKLIALPEYCGGLVTQGSLLNPPSALEENHKVLNELRKFSSQFKVFTLIGSIAISSSNGKIFNRSYIIDDRGKILSRYDKIHLFDVTLSENEKYRESSVVSGGNTISVCKTKLGILGQTVCYDLRFPEMSRALALAGSEVLIAPSAWVKGPMKEEHWITINKTRAIENGCYVISPDQVGNIYCGRSLVVDPYGKILLDMKKKQGIGYVEIDLKKVKQIRKSLPLLKNRRTDTYTTLKI